VAAEPASAPLMRKRPSSIDVARRAEVSQATVSYVLSGRTDKSISKETKERVFQAAEDLGYVPNRLADGILRGKTQTVGVLMPDFAHSFNSQVLQGIEEAAADDGYRLLIAHNRNHPEYELHQVKMLQEHRVDGLIAVTDERTIDSLQDWVIPLSDSGVPVVIVDDLKLDGRLDTVVSDDVSGARAAVEHLIAMGHKRIAYLGGGSRASTSRDRRQGYEEALAAHGLVHHPEWVVGTSYRRNEDPDLSPLMTLAKRPTAVFCASDGLASQAMMVLAKRGFRIPGDLAFVGYGDLEWARYMNLTSVDQHPTSMGRVAAHRLVQRILGESGPPVTEKMEPSLVVRGSSVAA
jgi:LacI family transcriptional regulator